MLQAFALAKIVALVLAIALLYVPIHATVPIAQELAGKDTKLTASFTVSILISIGSLAGVITTVWRGRERSAELERLRGKCEAYEQRLAKEG
jgi:hypothetical protein